MAKSEIMDIPVSKILKRRNLQEVTVQIDDLNTILKDRMSVFSGDNVVEIESLVTLQTRLAQYLTARSYMHSPRYQAWEAEGKPGNFEDYG